LTLRVAVLLEEPGNGVSPADTDEPADNRVFALDKERKELWRYPYNKKAEADLDTPEANQMREKLAQRKAKRRARFERIFTTPTGRRRTSCGGFEPLFFLRSRRAAG
jgi:hypothetical protein